MDAALRKALRVKLTDLLEGVRDYLVNQRAICGFEIHQEHDTHAYFRLAKNLSRTIHVQAYPGMSSETEANIFAQLLDYEKLIEIRRQKSAPIGNEHGARITHLTDFQMISFPYDPSIVGDHLIKALETA